MNEKRTGKTPNQTKKKNIVKPTKQTKAKKDVKKLSAPTKSVKKSSKTTRVKADKPTRALAEPKQKRSKSRGTGTPLDFTSVELIAPTAIKGSAPTKRTLKMKKNCVRYSGRKCRNIMNI